MKYKARRGVCIGVDRHMAVGDPPISLEPALAKYLTDIGAIEAVPDPQPETAADTPAAPDVPSGKKPAAISPKP